MSSNFLSTYQESIAELKVIRDFAMNNVSDPFTIRKALDKAIPLLEGKVLENIDTLARALLGANPGLKNNRIKWIKELRVASGFGLKECKDSIERVEQQLGG